MLLQDESSDGRIVLRVLVTQHVFADASHSHCRPPSPSSSVAIAVALTPYTALRHKNKSCAGLQARLKTCEY